MELTKDQANGRSIALSILTPAIPERLDQLRALMAELEMQIGEQPVEHLVLMDNRRRTIGEKRDALLRAARGDFLAFVDDDDSVTSDYVESIVQAIRTEPEPHVITFQQQSIINGQTGLVEFKLGNPNEAFKPGADPIRRNAWHVCAWRRALAILSGFPANNYGEDWSFASKLCSLKNLREVHIPKILHRYVYSDQTTLATANQG